MDAERWRQITSLYHAARARDGNGRSAFLDAACDGDDALRDDVESLLAGDARANGFTVAAAGALADLVDSNPETVDGIAKPGTTLGSYRIERRLGRGGMGAVFLAYDTTLHRSVALKLLDASADGDSVRSRLLREARTAAALNHPHICTIHEVGHASGATFIAMEYVDGRSLRDRLDEGALKLEEAVRYGMQAAEAFAYAHDHGVVHRDFKAANAMITGDGRLKIVDFGLARRDDALVASETTMASLVPAGAAAGTPYAMAPEQVRGEAADARTDIWALGVLLYEMVTGAQPFSAATAPELFSSILRDAPRPWPNGVAVEIKPVIERCLEKDPARRCQHAREVGQALDAIQSGKVPPWTAWRYHLRHRRSLVPAAVLLSIGAVLLAGGFFAWQAWRAPQPGEPLRAVALTTFPGIERHPSFSPDGNYVAFMWTGPNQDNADIYVQMIGAGSPLRLTTDPRSDASPVWSPDGRSIAFLRGETSSLIMQGQSEVRLIPPLGGPERKVAEIRDVPLNPSEPAHLAWCSDSSCLVFSDFQGEQKPNAVFVVALETGEKRQLTNPQPPAFYDANPVISPDGRSLVFQRFPTGAGAELYWLALGKGLTAVGEARRLTLAALNARHPAWMPDGKEVLFSARGSLWRLAISGDSPPARLPFVGEDGLWPAVSRPQPGRPLRLVYVQSFEDRNIWRVETSAPGAPSSSPPAVAISSTREDTYAQFSPDGQRVAFISNRAGDAEVWLADPDGSGAVQLTSMGAPGTGTPRWSPDGQTIAFNADLEGHQEIYVVPAAGGRPRRLTAHPANDIIPSFSHDGNWIYFMSNRTGEAQIWRIPAAGGDAAQVTLNVGFVALPSPDGAYVYYTQTSGPVASALWRIPTSGGDPVKVLEGVVMRAFAVLERGIYYVDQPAGEARLQFFDFATGRSTTVARNLGNVRTGITASPDGRSILYTRLDSSVDNLMLVENFR